MKVATNLGDKLGALKIEPVPGLRGVFKGNVKPLTADDLAARWADATARRRAR